MASPFPPARLPLPASELLRIHAEALFRSDAAGRLRFNADPGYPEDELDPAPRFWMGRTQQGAIWRARADLPGALVERLAALAATVTPPADPASQPTPTRGSPAAAIRAALEAHAPVSEEWSGPAFWIPESSVPPGTVLITPDNAHLLEAHFPWKRTPRALHAAGPLVAAVADDRAVAVCYCARLTAVAAEAGVDTTESARGHGHGRAAVAGWAAAIRQRGLLPLYSTSWDNHASRGIARRLGMLAYADTWSVA
ncbi:MAG TPA: GNAT family N-acetyltransferase [Herpetosiphonaceae bacterium]|nr:GNAT family N-acetyltransferase [Herpetosiphonaceae bacterium]